MILVKEDVWLSLAVVLFAAMLTGCASKHAYMAKPANLGPPQWSCNARNECELVQMWEPSQLTPGGCVLHTIVTGGHIAWECRKGKPSGRWIWFPDAVAAKKLG